MMKRNIFSYGLKALLLSALAAFNVQAAGVYSFTSAPNWYNDPNSVTVGFNFTANKDIKVKTLGFYDADQNGLINGHDVGIFDGATQQLLGHAEVPNGTQAFLDGMFRYVSITPFTLTAGKEYILAAYADNVDGYTYGVTGANILGLNVSSLIDIPNDAGIFNYGPKLAFPSDHYGYSMYPVANFNGNAVSPVPVPAAVWLFGSALTGVGLFGRRRKAQLVAA